MSRRAPPPRAPPTVALTFFTDAGETVERTTVVPPQSRQALAVAALAPALASTPVATAISADRPIVSARSSYWPQGFGAWVEGHSSEGLPQLALRWGAAGARVGTADAADAFLLLANPGTATAAVRATVFRADGSTLVRGLAVAPTSRLNLHVNRLFPALADEAFGVLLEVTNGLPIAVERATYRNAAGQPWAGGASAAATPLP